MKREIIPTRRRTALRRILTAAILLLIANRIFLMGLLFPVQALRQNEEVMGTGRTDIVCRDWNWKTDWKHVAYLSENENVTMLSRSYLSYLGWTLSFGEPLDCSEPAPLYAGCWETIGVDGVKSRYVFGRVDDAAIERLEIEVMYDGAADREKAVQQIPQLSSRRDSWMEKDGRTYFLIRFDGQSASRILPQIAGYDAAGREITRIWLPLGYSAY